jgi:hypothetical protein
MQNDLNNRPLLNNRRSGIGGGTSAAIIAGVLILGALFFWGPWNNGPQSGTATNTSMGTTTGSTSPGRPAAPVTAPAPPPGSTR